MTWGFSKLLRWFCGSPFYKKALDVVLGIWKAEHFTMERSWTLRNKELLITKIYVGWLKQRKQSVFLRKLCFSKEPFYFDVKLINTKFCFQKSSSIKQFLSVLFSWQHFYKHKLSKPWLREAILCTLLLSHITQNKPFQIANYHRSADYTGTSNFLTNDHLNNDVFSFSDPAAFQRWIISQFGTRSP